MAPIVSEQYKRKKKKEILAGALACFAKKGFQAATIDDIVAYSGISKGAIYNYFKSKEEIYLELMNEQTEATSARLVESISNLSSAEEKLEYLFDIYREMSPFSQERKDKIVVHLEFTLHSSRDENLNRILKERGKKFFLKLITDILEEGQAAGEFRPDADPNYVACMFWTIMDGAMLHSVLNEEYPYRTIIDYVKSLVLKDLQQD
ncbi:TetR family transcriptional regulator [Cytobacillus oceanisediminis]|uniref:TetR family transcriptional regulator n=1 Tax=Cytobacillus oceanisediminis TaxID=665099 RepID=A0A2V2ZKU8_9BACI|nr:TetR/AcrR family transcriptional regulator [Cytobacillus oceanisediminis]PWW20559.1 TetR family transcriptional regulator [Cytobacillus oceanisediminis]